MKKGKQYSHLASHSIAVSLLFLCSMFYAPCFNLKAQGNLQFNQVLNPSISAVNLPLGGWSSVTLTIPNGKVWKVENASYARYTGNTTLPSYQWSNTSGVNFFLEDYMIDNYVNNANGILFPKVFPIWLSPGQYNLTIINSSLNNQTNTTWRGTLSVIEFNIVP